MMTSLRLMAVVSRTKIVLHILSENVARSYLMGHGSEPWNNHAYVLLLIRDGVVKTQDDLMRHFGITRGFIGTPRFCSEDDIRNTLHKLSDAGLIECQHEGSTI